jgi:hypothetical protein
MAEEAHEQDHNMPGSQEPLPIMPRYIVKHIAPWSPSYPYKLSTAQRQSKLVFQGHRMYFAMTNTTSTSEADTVWATWVKTSTGAHISFNTTCHVSYLVRVREGLKD